VRGLDVALAEFRRVTLQHTGLHLREFDLALGGGALQPQQALVLGEEIVAPLDAADAAGGETWRPWRRSPCSTRSAPCQRWAPCDASDARWCGGKMSLWRYAGHAQATADTQSCVLGQACDQAET
jgi:hypothetical protein